MKRFYIANLVAVIVLLSSTCLYAIPLSNPANRHNFSSGSTSAVQAITDPGDPTQFDTQVCVFCHTPHSATADSVLWNRGAPATASFPTYANGDINAIAINDNVNPDGAQALSGYGGPDYPNGASRLCLSCHDGATAINNIVVGGFLSTNYNTVQDYIDTDPIALNGLKVDLATSHPISFVYSGAVITQINTWHAARDSAVFGYNLLLPTVVDTPLDSQQRMQCTTCHDPHDDNTVGTSPFWRHTNYNDVCNNCHSGGPAVDPPNHGV